MERVAPNGGIYQAGTFNGSPVPLAAGIATLDILEMGALDGLNSAGESFRKSLSEIVSDLKPDYSVTGIASMFKVFFGPLPKDYSEALRSDKAGYYAFFRRMLASGVFLTPSQFETDFISTAHSSEVLENTLEAFKSNLIG
jgi:glutamate-1-semialdehyde 2,1-aminomutase